MSATEHPVTATYTLDTGKLAQLRHNYDEGLAYSHSLTVKERQDFETAWMYPKPEHIMSLRARVGMDKKKK